MESESKSTSPEMKAPATAQNAPPVAQVPAPNPLAHVAIPFQTVDYGLKGFHLDAKLAPAELVPAAKALDLEGFALDTITGVDWLAEGQLELVYDFFHPCKNLRVVIRSRVPRDKSEVPTISAVFPGANWHERETRDFFGITFTGHPNLTPFLLPEDATYHPLRKDFSS
jgi:NADH-quinone oxidoreductase subunit C